MKEIIIMQGRERALLEYCPWVGKRGAFPGDSEVKNPLAMQEMQNMWVWSLGQEDLLEVGMATHSSILVGKIPRTEDPGSLRSMGSQKIGHYWSDWAGMHRQGRKRSAAQAMRWGLDATMGSSFIAPERKQYMGIDKDSFVNVILEEYGHSLLIAFTFFVVYV